MNDTRRKALAKIVTAIDDLHGKLQDAATELEALKDEEQEYYDNMPESFQQGEKGQAAEEAANQLSEAFDKLELCMGEFDECKQHIEAATE